MKGVILAAGIGSRLQPITDNKPKCMIKVSGQPILRYQIDAYKAAGVSELFIVVGYQSEEIVNYCKHIKDIAIEIVENNDYESTNNMYSLYLLREYLESQPFILNNADLAIDHGIVDRLLKDGREDLIAVDPSQYNEESMKITVDKDGKVADISKKINADEAYGCSIDFYKISAATSKALFAHMRSVIDVDKDANQWTEVALQKLLQKSEIVMYPLDIGDLSWVEIDNYSDLELADFTFSKLGQALQDVETIFLDLDGTIYVGETPVVDGYKFIEGMRRHGKKLFFLSNNSSKDKKQYVNKLSAMQIDVSENEIILSSDGLIEFLKKNKVKTAFVLGTESLRKSLESQGIDTASKQPEYVVVGYDTELNYDKLRQACLYINGGVDYIATHQDINCPTENGPIPDIGTLIAVLEMTTGVEPTNIFGKPFPAMVDHIDHIDLSKSVFIGDRIYTDMALAQNVNAESILVLSGETTRDSLDLLEDYNGHYVSSLTRLAELADL